MPRPTTFVSLIHNIVREQVNQQGGNFGIDAVDVRIRRADLPRQISEKVFSRMQSKRARGCGI